LKKKKNLIIISSSRKSFYLFLFFKSRGGVAFVASSKEPPLNNSRPHYTLAGSMLLTFINLSTGNWQKDKAEGRGRWRNGKSATRHNSAVSSDTFCTEASL
jgi:hypothetical protein